MRPRPRVLAVLLLLAPLLLVPGRTTLAPWTDPDPPSATSSLSALTLAAPVLTCTQSGTSAVVGWTPSSTPTALSYSAQVVSPSSPLTPVSNAVTVSPGLLDGLLGGLLGSSITVRVTATLPGTTWTVSTERTLFYRLVLVVPTVSCT